MTGAAKLHEQVAKIPAPTTLFTAIESAALKFELICFVDDVETSGRVKSDLHYEIFAAFRVEGISVSAPPSVQDIRGVDRLVEALSGKAAPQAGAAE